MPLKIMLTFRRRAFRPQGGATMIEVLITIVILAFGLLGLVGLQAKVQLAEVESYQRAQAVVLLNDMVDRLNANPGTANNYVSASVFGTGDTTNTPPTPPCPTAVGAARDQCEWSAALKGAAELQGTTKLGAMTDARGCIALIQAANTGAGVCTPGIYLVTVTWQGLNSTVAPSGTCGQNLYGTDTYRRAISARVVIGLPGCT
jgi:type IV pilus assembly protein PilV